MKQKVLLAAGALASASVSAADFRVGDVDIQLNTNIVAGAAWRISGRSDDLVGKSNLDANVCAGPNQSCQGLARLQTHPAEALRDAPGAPSVNGDDGNLNYDRWDIVQSPFRVNQDVNIQFGRFGIFSRWLWFYDFENNSFIERSPNRITPDNMDEVAITGDTAVSNRYSEVVFGRGGPVESRRTQGRTLSQIGTDFQLLDLNFYGDIDIPVPGLGRRTLNFRLGRQTVSWGESTVLVINSINQVNPANVNNLYRTGFTLDEVFTPVGMAFASMNLTDNVSVEAYYQYEWDSVEIPPQGSFFSFLDLGTPNIGIDPTTDRRAPGAFDGAPRGGEDERGAIVGTVNAAFGGAAEDPYMLGSLLDNPLAGVTPTTANVPRLPDKEARHQGQYGAAMKWFLPDLNFGTEFGFYFMNYHSKLPYANIYAADASCARAAGNDQGLDASNTFEFLSVCSNVPLAFYTPGALRLNLDLVNLALSRPDTIAELGLTSIDQLPGVLDFLLGGDPGRPVDSAIAFDTMRLQFEYPEDLKMFGVSFNTPFGANYSLQGEVAYRPRLPLQVSLTDLAFAGLGPTATSCHLRETDCAGASSTFGFDTEGNVIIYDDNHFVPAEGVEAFPDALTLGAGAGVGVARAFPTFLIPYRGQEIGSNEPNGFIRGWEPFRVLQYNLGATRVYGASEPPASVIGADQIILAYEVGATHVLGFPDFDQLQIQGPDRQTTHASAGADGSGADGSRLACSTNPTCSVGPDGLRFNPFQAQRDEFAHRFSWGYRVVAILRWESVWPGWSIEPLLIWGHDIKGNAPGPGPNFVEGRKTLNSTFQFRYRTALSFNVSYQLFTGGGSNHVLRDRDNLGFFVRYQF